MTYAADHICYKNDNDAVNRAHAVCFAIVSAIKLYHKTFLYQNHTQINYEALPVRQALASGKTIFTPGFPRSPFHYSQIEEAMTDHFLIGTFYEIIAKASLLDQGYLIHQVEHGGQVPDAIKRLWQKQRAEPVDVVAYLELDPFADYEKAGKNSLQYLSTRTVSYSLLYKSAYRNALPFSEQFKRHANYYRTYRNLIHFPLSGASESTVKAEYNAGSEDRIAVIESEISLTIRPLYEQLTAVHSFPLSMPT